MRIVDVKHWTITVELSPVDAVSLSYLCERGIDELTDEAVASRLKVPRGDYYAALGSAFRAGALAAVCYGHLTPPTMIALDQDLQEVGLQ